MNLTYQTRPLSQDELQYLQRLMLKVSKGGANGVKFYYFPVAALLGAGFTWLAMLAGDGFLGFLFGTLAVFSFAFIVFMPYEMYKMRRKNKHTLQQFQSFIQKGTVDTCLIKAERIALAEEYEDEGDLYIIACNQDQLLYMWDTDYTLRKKFPCLDFEVYEDAFSNLIGRQINPLSSRIKPIIIDTKAKWNYMSKVGVPEHLQLEQSNFDTVLETIRACADTP